MSFNLLPSEDISLELAARLKSRRLAENLTQEGLSRRSGVPLGTLKNFERRGRIGLISFIRLVVALDDERALDNLLLEARSETLDDILQAAKKPQRGRIT
ncbi:MAG TPA: XRE family transcriptional regulator [Rhodospirillales bacterium]|nr:XRE family transcriptional regulator [Rhodospirillales bacterium]